MNALFLSFAFFHLFLFSKTQEITLPASFSSSCQGFTITNSGSTTKFGYTIDGGGDFNGDKIPDLIITDYQDPNPSTLFVIYGIKTGHSNLDVATMTPQQGFRITGLSLKGTDNTNLASISGDVDGDGIADLVIGAALADSSQGAVYVVYGKEGGYADFDIANLASISTAFKISGNGGNFGWNVNSKVDINGDKVPDISIGATVKASNKGMAYVIFGQKTRFSSFSITSLTPSQGFTISAPSLAYTGAALASAGDFNGDDIDDLIVTAPGYYSTDGGAFVVYGKPGSFSNLLVSSFASNEGFKAQAASSLHYLGLTASDAGDFNNDSISDILVGAYKSNSNAGFVLLAYGKKDGPPDLLTSSMLANQGIQITGISANDMLGSSLANLGDINGDGISDIIIGAKGFSSNKGAMYVIYGTKDQPATIDLSTLSSDQGFKISGGTAAAALGTSVKNIGDINQDGVSDVVVGAPGTNAAYVLFLPNAFGCNTCKNSSYCQMCQPGFNFTFNGLCYKECPIFAPYKVNSQCFSKEPKSQPEDLLSDNIKGGVKKGSTATYATNKILNLWSPASALPFIYGQLKMSITYMRYLDISRTEKLEQLYQLYVDSDTSVIPFLSMSSSIKDSFPAETLPFMFEKYYLPSAFLTNFGDDLLGLLVIFAAAIASSLVHFFMKRFTRNFRVLTWLFHRSSLILSNFLIGSLAESLGPITFYATLQFKKSNIEKRYYLASPIVCALFLALGVCIVAVNILILRKFHIIRKNLPLRNSKERQKSNKGFLLLRKKFERVSVLFEELDDSSLYKQLAFLLFCFRSITESLVVGLLFEHPMLQAILLLLLNLLLLLYLVIQKPFESKIDLVQQLVLLLSIFVCNPCLAIMAGTDLTFKNFDKIIKRTSDTIFFVLVTFQFLPLFFFVLKIFESIWKFFKLVKTQNASSKNQRKIKHGRSSVSPLDSSFSTLNQRKTSLSDMSRRSQLSIDQLGHSAFETRGELITDNSSFSMEGQSRIRKHGGERLSPRRKRLIT